MIITLGGTPGSGKSTVAEILGVKLGLKHLSSGDFMRQMAKERGITLQELSLIAEKDSGKIDLEIDERTKRLGREENNFVMDSRLAFHFIPQSFKVFLTVDPKTGAQRIFSHKRSEESSENADEAYAKMMRRRQSEALRYKEYYGINPLDESNYDVVIDTTKIPAEKVAEKIMGVMKRKKVL